jgi:histone H3/H4
MAKKSSSKKTTTKKKTTKKSSTKKKPPTKKASATKKTSAKKSTKKKTTKKTESHIAKAPIRRLMKEKGAKLVAAGAVDHLIEFLEKTASETTKRAIQICSAEKRKRIMAGDIHKAALKIQA